MEPLLGYVLGGTISITKNAEKLKTKNSIKQAMVYSYTTLEPYSSSRQDMHRYVPCPTQSDRAGHRIPRWFMIDNPANIRFVAAG